MASVFLAVFRRRLACSAGRHALIVGPPGITVSVGAFPEGTDLAAAPLA